MHCFTHAPLEDLMSEVNHQLKKLSHEAKKGDVAAETTGQNLTQPQLFTPPLRFQFSLCIHTCTHTYTTHTQTQNTHASTNTHTLCDFT